MSSGTGSLLHPVTVRLRHPLISRPLWCLALSHLITEKQGLSRSQSSNLMKDPPAVCSALRRRGVLQLDSAPASLRTFTLRQNKKKELFLLAQDSSAPDTKT